MFFGGARGGGKTDGVLGKWSIKAERYGEHFNAIMFRRTTTSAEDAIERSKQIFGPTGAVFNEAKLRWRMRGGGRVSFAYLENVKDAEAYQGRNVTDAWVEEAGQFATSTPIMRLFGVLRSAARVPVQLILTANPGGAGQHWIRERYGLYPFPLGPKELRLKLPNGATHRIAVIPSRIENNRYLGQDYVNRLQMVGSAQLVKAWLKGDWTAIEGAFFDCWDESRHVISPFAIPEDWLRFRSGDWGSHSPYSIGWWAVVTDDYDHDQQVLPRGALVRYREDYGRQGGKLTAEQVGQRIASAELADRKLAYGVLDPSTFKVDGGPSIAERINKVLLDKKMPAFREADNKRVNTQQSKDKRGPMSGWDQMRGRLIGTAKPGKLGIIDWTQGSPMAFCFSTCTDSIRTIPVLQHDPDKAEDLDTKAEDHCFTGDTLVRTLKGVYSFADLIDRSGFVRSHDGAWHAFRSVRLVKRDQPIVRLTFSDGTTIRCTPDHRFLTMMGWMDAKDLLGITTRSLSPTPSKNLRAAAITSAAVDTIAAPAACCIDSFGRRQMADRFQKAGTSITRTAIATIMRPITWIASLLSLTNPASTASNLASVGASRSTLLVSRRPNGMAATLERIGIASTMPSIARRSFMPSDASSADSAITRRLPTATTESSVRRNARRLGVALLAWMTRRENAQSVAGGFKPIDTQKPRRAREPAGPFPALAQGPVCLKVEEAGSADVYCFTVPDTGNFELANGMIAAQCADDWRYACMSRPWIRQEREKAKDAGTGYRAVQDDLHPDDSIKTL